MKILITGSTGQLARELQSELAGTGKLLASGTMRWTSPYLSRFASRYACCGRT